MLTTSGTLDTVGELYQGETLLSSDDDSGAGSNFLIERDLTAGTEYRLKVKGANSSVSGTFSLGVYRYFTATVHNYYDHGYHVRYGELENAGKVQINSYTDEVSARFLQTVGLRVLRNEPTYFNSALDQCKGTVTACADCVANVNNHTSENCNINLLCSHSGDKCTDRASLITNFQSNVDGGNNTTTCAFWTGHKILSTNGDQTIAENRSCSSGENIFVLGISPSRAYISKGMLVHELGHQYDLPDHYHEIRDGRCVSGIYCYLGSACNGGNATSPRSKTCIMYSGSENITNAEMLCPGFKNDIIAHLSDHH